MLHQRLLLITSFLLLSSLPCTHVAADFSVTMTGTIESGDLNGNSVDGEEFVVVATLLNGTDINSLPTVGFFELSSAQMQIGQSLVFDFDASTLVYAQSYQTTGDDFVIGFRVPTDFGGNPDTISYADEDQPNLPFAFDPNIFQAFSYSAFDLPFPQVGSGTQIFINGSDTLNINSIDLTGASVTAVPEPNTLMLSGLSAFALISFCVGRRGRISIN